MKLSLFPYRLCNKNCKQYFANKAAGLWAVTPRWHELVEEDLLCFLFPAAPPPWILDVLTLDRDDSAAGESPAAVLKVIAWLHFLKQQ